MNIRQKLIQNKIAILVAVVLILFAGMLYWFMKSAPTQVEDTPRSDDLVEFQGSEIEEKDGDRLVWRHVGTVTEKASSEKLGYRRELVSEPPDMYGVDILSCPYHELAKELGEEKAVLCICHMDKEYSQGFRHIRYDRNSAVSEGARACEFWLRFDPGKE